MKINYTYPLLLLSAFLFIQCHKDEIIKIENEIIISENSNVSFLISVLNEDHERLANTKIEVDGIAEEFITDKNGVLLLEHINTPATGLKIKCTKEGYFIHLEAIHGKNNSFNLIDIILNNNSSTLVAEVGQKIHLEGGGSIQLPDFLLTHNGTLYHGPVHIKSKFYNPKSENFLFQFPNNFLGKHADESLSLLSPAGIYQLHFYDKQENEIYISVSNPVILTFPKSDLQQERLTSWSLNSDLPFWIKDESIEIINDHPVVSVTSSGYWNVSHDLEFVERCFEFTSQTDQPIQGIQAAFYLRDNEPLSQFTSNIDGRLCGYFPADETFILNYSLIGKELGSMDVSPDTNLSETIQIKEISLNEISGTLVNCQFQSLEKSYGIVRLMNNKNLAFAPLSEGTFLYSIHEVAHHLEIYDLITGKSLIQSIQPDQVSESLYLEGLVICDQNLPNVSSKISGHVMLDSDEDGISDFPLSNVTIALLNYNQEIISEVSTDEDGAFSFSVNSSNNYSLYYINGPPNYKLYRMGDLTPQGSATSDAITYSGYSIDNISVPPNEINEGYEFQLIPKGSGMLKGRLLLDANGDQVGDKSIADWKIFIQSENNFGPVEPKTIHTNDDGSFEYESENFKGKLYLGQIDGMFVTDQDSSPDPDGMDQTEANGEIPFRIINGESDEDNNFVININGSVLSARVYIDTNQDGIGDIPAVAEEIRIRARMMDDSPGRIIHSMRTDQYGKCQKFFSNTEEPLMLELITRPGFEVIHSQDQIPDDNTTNTTGNPGWLNITFEDEKIDDGNTFIIREI